MAAPPTAPPAGRRYAGRSTAERRADRRARILDAGLRLFGTQGYLATSIESLCATAAVSTRSFYEEFGSREELLRALHDAANTQALASVTAALAAAGDLPGDRATAAARAFVGVMTPDPRWSRIAYVEIVGLSPAMEAQRREWMARWAELIEREGLHLAAHGHAPHRSFALTAVGLVGAVNELLSHWLSQPHPGDVEDLVAELVRLLVAGLVAD